MSRDAYSLTSCNVAHIPLLRPISSLRNHQYPREDIILWCACEGYSYYFCIMMK